MCQKNEIIQKFWIAKKNKIIALAFVTGCNIVVHETCVAIYVVYLATSLNIAYVLKRIHIVRGTVAWVERIIARASSDTVLKSVLRTNHATKRIPLESIFQTIEERNAFMLFRKNEFVRTYILILYLWEWLIELNNFM